MECVTCTHKCLQSSVISFKVEIFTDSSLFGKKRTDRDLRSPNIFVSSLDPNAKVNVKVGDFGLSQQAGIKMTQYLATWYFFRKCFQFLLSKLFIKGNG